MDTDNKRLARWMEASFITDADVASKVGIDKNYVYMMRTGRRNVTDGFRWKFAQAYGHEFADKLFAKDETPTC